MRIWTIQPADLYEKFKTRQVLLADGRYGWQNFKPAYRWMAEQMRRRLPPSHARFPWWGWYRYRGVRRPKPDLRDTALLPKGQKGVRLELDLDDRGILLSDFGQWHNVLNNRFCSHDEAEDNRFDQEEKEADYRYDRPRPEALQSRVLASWERIFDLTGGDPEWLGKVSKRAIQATFWELRLQDVTDVTFFTAR